ARLGQNLPADAGERPRFFDHGFIGKGAVSFGADLLEYEAKGGLGALRRLRVHAYALGQLVRGLKADAPDVVGQAIRVFAHQIERFVAVGLVNAKGAVGADAVRLQKDHDAAHSLLLLPTGPDLREPARTDAFDFAEK